MVSDQQINSSCAVQNMPKRLMTNFSSTSTGCDLLNLPSLEFWSPIAAPAGAYATSSFCVYRS